MSKSVHYRLPEKLLEDARVYADLNGISVTDMVIKGLELQIKQPGNDKPVPEIIPVSVSVEDKTQAIKAKLTKLQEKAANRPYFKPCPKDSR